MRLSAAVVGGLFRDEEILAFTDGDRGQEIRAAIKAILPDAIAFCLQEANSAHDKETLRRFERAHRILSEGTDENRGAAQELKRWWDTWASDYRSRGTVERRRGNPRGWRQTGHKLLRGVISLKSERSALLDAIQSHIKRKLRRL